MYQALYRKYRPRSFSQVVGQPHITDTLKNELKSGRISHAYLFTGSRGTGKTTCAKILAKAVNCLHPQEGDPCNQCEMCVSIDEGAELDILEIDAASNNGVENIRELRENAVFTPAKGKYRVYIIDEVHMLSTGAFNALLKTLEEPPTHVVFILATTEVHKLPATILSRCQRFDFKRIEPEVIAGRLSYVAKEEGLRLTPEAALLIASMADGGMRDALSILDLCAGQEGDITEDVVEKVSGMAGREYLFSLSDALLRRDAAAALSLIGELHGASVDMQRLCEELIGHYRNLMLIKTIPDPRGMVVSTAAELSRLTAQAAPAALETILYSLRVLEDALDRMGRGNRRAELEMAAVRLSAPQLDGGQDALLERIAALERAVKLLSAGRPADLPAPVPQAAGQEAFAPPLPSEASSPPEGGQAPAIQRDATAPLSEEDCPPWEEPPVAGHDVLQPDIPLDEPPANAGTPPQPPENVAPPAPPTNQTPADAPEGDTPCAQWPEILALLSKTCPLIHGVLQGSSAYIRGDLLLIDSKNSQFRNLVKGENSLYRDQIRKAATEVTGAVYRLGPYHKKETTVQEADPLDQFLKRAGQLGLL